MLESHCLTQLIDWVVLYLKSIKPYLLGQIDIWTWPSSRGQLVKNMKFFVSCPFRSCHKFLIARHFSITYYVGDKWVALKKGWFLKWNLHKLWATMRWLKLLKPNFRQFIWSPPITSNSKPTKILHAWNKEFLYGILAHMVVGTTLHLYIPSIHVNCHLVGRKPH